MSEQITMRRELAQWLLNSVEYLAMRADDIGTSNAPVAEELRAILAEHPLTTCLRDNGDLIALQATVAQQAQMIERLRGGPTPGFTAVDMANTARDERTGIAESLIERLAIAYPDSDALMSVECFADWLSKEMKP